MSTAAPFAGNKNAYDRRSLTSLQTKTLFYPENLDVTKHLLDASQESNLAVDGTAF